MRPHLLTSPPLAVALLLLLSSTPLDGATPDPISYVTYGPGIVSLDGWYGLYAAYGNGSAPPYASTAPIAYAPCNGSAAAVAIGLSLSLGQQSALDGIEPSLQFIVDLINFRGGVSVAGAAHCLSLTYSRDGGSDELTQLIYQDMAASQQYAAYLAPYGDPGTQALQSFLASTQLLMLTPGNTDPADFPGGDNLFSPLNTADMTWVDLLSAVNERAAAQALAGQPGSAWGIRSLCMYSSAAVLVQAAARGVRAWVEAENARRGVGLEPIVVYADVVWSLNVTGTYWDYAATMSATCPDGVDVMVLQDGSDTDLNVALALTASQLKPKAAMGLNFGNAVVLALASGNALAAAAPLEGWLLSYPVNFPPATTLPSKGGKLGSSYDAGYAQYMWNLAANVTVSTPNIAYVYWAVLDIVQAAISQAASLNASDLRAATLSLNGEVGMLGLLDFSNVTGVNLAALSVLRQVNASAAVSNLQTGTLDLVYPYPWPWPSRLQAGSVLRIDQSNALALVAVVACVLGSWVGQIITEQSVFVRRKAGHWQAWLVIVALAQGGVGIWCSQLLLASALSVSTPQGSALPLSFSAEVAMLAWLPAIVLTWCGLLVLMSGVDDNAVTDVSRSPELRSHIRLQREEKKKLAALSASAHVRHLLHAVTWRTVAGALMLAAAVVLSRVTLWYVWIQDAAWGSAGWAWAVTTVLDAALIPLSQLMFFHALRNRLFAVFLFAAAVMADWEVQLLGLTFRYEPDAQPLSSALRTANLSLSVLDLIVGILAVVILLIFVGLQFSRMRLSRNGLTVLVASLEATVAEQSAGLQADAALIAQLQAQLHHMARMVELISINSPLPTEYGFAMAACADYATYSALLSSPAPPPPDMADSRTHGRAPSDRSSQSDKSEKGSIIRGTKPPSRLSSEESAPQDPTMTMTAPNASDFADDSQALNLPVRARVLSVKRALGPRVSVGPPAESDVTSGHRLIGAESSGSPTGAAFPSTPPDHAADREGGSRDPPGQGWAESAAVLPFPAPSRQESTPAPTLSKTDPADALARDSLLSLPGAARPLRETSDGASSFAKRASTTVGAKGWKRFEDRLTAALEQQHAYKRKKAQSTVSTGRGPKAGAGEASESPAWCAFDLGSPLLGHDLLVGERPSQAMAAILSHPVCVEVLKAALTEVHSVENLIFYLHVQRYKRVQSGRLRKLLALCIHGHFIGADAPEQINLSTRMRDAIEAAVTRKGDAACTAELFRDAEREVLTLMNDNVLRSLPPHHHRLCAWIMAVTPMKPLTEVPGACSDDDGESGIAAELLSSLKR